MRIRRHNEQERELVTGHRGMRQGPWGTRLTFEARVRLMRRTPVIRRPFIQNFLFREALRSGMPRVSMVARLVLMWIEWIGSEKKI